MVGVGVRVFGRICAGTWDEGGDDIELKKVVLACLTRPACTSFKNEAALGDANAPGRVA